MYYKNHVACVLHNLCSNFGSWNMAKIIRLSYRAIKGLVFLIAIVSHGRSCQTSAKDRWCFEGNGIVVLNGESAPSVICGQRG